MNIREYTTRALILACGALSALSIVRGMYGLGVLLALPGLPVQPVLDWLAYAAWEAYTTVQAGIEARQQGKYAERVRTMGE